MRCAAAALLRFRPPGRPRVPISSSSCPTTWAFPTSAATASEIQTPNLDALATNGLRFTQFYNTARCCPTRATLLTGLYPHQAGMGHMMEDRRARRLRGRLEPPLRHHRRGAAAGRLPHLHVRQMARHAIHTLRRADQAQLAAPARLRPLLRHHHRRRQLLRSRPPSAATTPTSRPRTIPSTSRSTSTTPTPSATTPSVSSSNIRRKRPDQPFFMYVAYTAAHWPMHALPKDIAKYRASTTAATSPLGTPASSG